ncbi:MAG: hypothetical protein JO208_05180 [Alphaproteobacteria bacterium]|nr:hypothetical protein [Alphaproteobacteria bacterium]
MIISFSKNFIFIRTRKTASSTIETVLRKGLEPGDVFVRAGGLRHRKDRTPEQKGAHSPQAVPVNEGENVAGHMGAADVRKLVPASFWNGCFRFTSERHPYEKAVSLAHYNFGKVKNSEGDFSEFLEETVQRGNYRSFDQYAIDGEVVVSDFIRHETLVEDLRRIGERIGVAVPAELPRKRTGFRTDRRPAAEVLSDEQKQQVFRTCREEFELLGYAP